MQHANPTPAERAELKRIYDAQQIENKRLGITDGRILFPFCQPTDMGPILYDNTVTNYFIKQNGAWRLSNREEFAKVFGSPDGVR